MRHLRDLLPKGQTLPDESWEQRHRWMVNLLWFHVAGLFAFSLLQGFPVWHSALDAAPVAAAAIVERFADGRKLRSAIVATGLLTASALVVHIAGPARERRRRPPCWCARSETEEQATVLRELGCERAQGYALARPAAAEVIFGLVSPARAVPSSAPRR
jgi:hypothetical protein